MSQVTYTSIVGSLMYVIMCTNSDIYYTVDIVSHFRSNLGSEHYVAIKHILKYIWRTRNYIMVYSSRDLIPVGHIDSNFQANKDIQKSTFRSLFTLGG